MTVPTLTLPGVTDITATSARPFVTLTYAEIATGGTITDYNDGTDDWKIHTFDSSDDLVTTQEIEWEYLVVAGGGGGAVLASGGGGAGGFRKFVAGEAGNTGAGVLTLAADTYTITVGAGGPGAIYDGTSTTSYATEGNPSSVAALSVSDGGGAGVSPGETQGASHDGGSGGGGRGDLVVYRSGGSGTAPQGHDGGDGYQLIIDGTQNALTNHGGGGGGASEAGTSPSGTTADPSDIIGGDGGDGIETSISGTATYYAGGGGGGAGNGSYTIAGLGGLGGGGDGSRGSGVSGNPGTANTGGGGGGTSRLVSGTADTGGTGGSGRVILRRKVA